METFIPALIESVTLAAIAVGIAFILDHLIFGE